MVIAASRQAAVKPALLFRRITFLIKISRVIALVSASLLWACAAIAQPIGGGGGGGGSLIPTQQAATSATTRTLQSSDCNTVIPFTAATPIIVYLPSTLAAGCTVYEQQLGAGYIQNKTLAGAILSGAFNATSGVNTQLIVSVIAKNSTSNNWLTLNTGQFFSVDGPILPILPPPIFTPTTSYYVNSSTGSDSNPGTQAAPWQTTTKVNNFTTFPAGTAVYLQGTFTGCFQFVAGTNVATNTTAINGLIVSPYGAGYTLTSNCPGTGSGQTGPQSAAMLFNGVSGVYVIGGTVQCNNNGTQFGIADWDTVNSNGVTGFTVQNATVTGCNISSAYSNDYSAEIEIGQYSSSCTPSTPMVNEVLVSGNSLSGTSVTSTDSFGLVAHGYYSSATCQNIQNVTFSNNLVFWIGGRATGAYGGGEGSGILCNGCCYYESKYNVVHDIGANGYTCGGPGGNWVYDTAQANIAHNETYNVQPTGNVSPGGSCDWLAYDADGGSSYVWIQYNHSYHNQGNAFEAYQNNADTNTWGPTTIRFNISEDDNVGSATTNSNGTGFTVGNMSFACGNCTSLPGQVYFYGNTTYIAPSHTTWQATCYDFQTVPLVAVIANNICQIPGVQGGYGGGVFVDGAGNTITNGVQFSHNDYYNSSNPGAFVVYSAPGNLTNYAAWAAAVGGGESGTILTVPGFSTTPTPGICTVTVNVGPQPCIKL